MSSRLTTRAHRGVCAAHHPLATVCFRGAKIPPEAAPDDWRRDTQSALPRGDVGDLYFRVVMGLGRWSALSSLN